MDDLPWPSVLSSKPFSIIGPQGSSFYAHADLLVKYSKVLAVEINGPMCEAATHEIHIKDIDGDLDDESVMRFLQFAYRGDYEVPPPDIEEPPKEVGVEPNPGKGMLRRSEYLNGSPWIPYPITEDDDSFMLRFSKKTEEGQTKKKKKKKIEALDKWADPPPVDPPPRFNKEELWSNFCDQALVQQVQQVQPWEPSPNSDPCENYSTVFLCHARLYVLSNRYECEALRNLCLQKLRLQLSRFTLHPSRYSDITKLVQHSYAHTQDFQEGSDKLRNLVSDYVVCHIEEMCSEPNFLNSLQECAGLARDIMVKLLVRLA